MGSRYSSAARASARRGSSSGSGSQAYVIGGIALAVVVIVVLMMRGKGDDEDPATPTTPPAASKPAAPPTPQSGSKKNVRTLTTPKTPAPALTAATLDQYEKLTDEVRTLYNEGSKLRTAGNNNDARAKQAQAKEKLDAMHELVAKYLLWQEEADMQNWIQPPEYARLTTLFQKAEKLDNLVRKGGG